MKKRELQPSETQCISRCIIKYWDPSSPPVKNRDARYERCLTACDVCGQA